MCANTTWVMIRSSASALRALRAAPPCSRRASRSVGSATQHWRQPVVWGATRAAANWASGGGGGGGARASSTTGAFDEEDNRFISAQSGEMATFKLSKRFVDRYKSMKAPFGFNGLGASSRRMRVPSCHICAHTHGRRVRVLPHLLARAAERLQGAVVSDG
jgi:hypothetical protein